MSTSAINQHYKTQTGPIGGPSKPHTPSLLVFCLWVLLFSFPAGCGSVNLATGYRAVTVLSQAKDKTEKAMTMACRVVAAACLTDDDPQSCMTPCNKSAELWEQTIEPTIDAALTAALAILEAAREKDSSTTAWLEAIRPGVCALLSAIKTWTPILGSQKATELTKGLDLIDRLICPSTTTNERSKDATHRKTTKGLFLGLQGFGFSGRIGRSFRGPRLSGGRGNTGRDCFVPGQSDQRKASQGVNMISITKAVLAGWFQSAELIKFGATGSAVQVLQVFLLRMALYTGSLDGDFGPLTESAVQAFQQLRCIDKDGIVGPQTRAQLKVAFEAGWLRGVPYLHPFVDAEVIGPSHPQLGTIPATKGKLSVFGGPNDPYDYFRGQACVSGADSPAELIQRHPALVELGILRPEVAKLTEYPVINGKRASTSWALDNETGYYCAMRWKTKGGFHYRNELNPRLLFWSPKNRRAVVCLRTDWGPGIDERVADLSNSAMDDLGLSTNDSCYMTWAADTAELGPVSWRGS